LFFFSVAAGDENLQKLMAHRFFLSVQEEGLTNPDVVTKYKAAAKIVNSKSQFS
jgi:hypothetical protein